MLNSQRAQISTCGTPDIGHGSDAGSVLLAGQTLGLGWVVPPL